MVGTHKNVLQTLNFHTAGILKKVHIKSLKVTEFEPTTPSSTA